MIKFFPNSTTFLSIYDINIQWYAVLIMTGALLTLFVSKKDLKESKYIDVNGFLDDFFVYVLWIGLIGARLWFCLFYNAKFYLSHPLEILKVYQGGLAIHGGLIFGITFAIFYCKKKNVSFFKAMDGIIPNILLAQALGRWGNFVNKECHGPEVSESFYNGILSFLKDGMNINGHYYEPEFFYESMLCIIGWLIIHFIIKKNQNKRGDLVWSYLMWYGLIRAFIEQRRTDALLVGNLKIAVIISFIFIMIGILGYIGIWDKFMPKRKPTILFDFDGTLMYTDATVVEGYRHLFKLHGDEKDFTKERQVEILGPALRELFPIYFPGIPYEQLLDEYHNKTMEVENDLNHPNPGAIEVLKYLKENDYNVGIISTKMKPDIQRTLKDFNLEDYIEDIFGLNEVKNVKPDPEGLFGIIKKNNWNGDDVIMVGDSKADLMAGKNYGAYTIAYIGNKDKAQTLIDLKPNKCVEDLSEIIKYLESEKYFTYNLK